MISYWSSLFTKVKIVFFLLKPVYKHKIMNLKETLLKALETEKAGNWNKAHEMVQDLQHPLAYWIHAYLHRKEPDLYNASYWYSRAKKPMPEYSFDKEWKEISDFIKNAEM
jgi:hypothetical protein